MNWHIMAMSSNNKPLIVKDQIEKILLLAYYLIYIIKHN